MSPFYIDVHKLTKFNRFVLQDDRRVGGGIETSMLNSLAKNLSVIRNTDDCLKQINQDFLKKIWARMRFLSCYLSIPFSDLISDEDCPYIMNTTAESTLLSPSLS